MLFWLLLDERLRDWQAELQRESRWRFVAEGLNPALESIERWRDDHRRLVAAVGSLSRQLNGLKQVVGPLPVDSSKAHQCLYQHLKYGARSVQVFSQALRMQLELMDALQHLRLLRRELALVASPPPLWYDDVDGQLETLEAEVTQAITNLLRFEAAASIRWDVVDAWLWQVPFNDLARPVLEPTTPRFQDAAQWRKTFFAFRNTLRRPPRPQPEPLPPTPRRRRKPKPPFVSKVLDLARSPAAVAQIEQGFLAISELDAHMTRFHQSVVQACSPNACDDVPLARVPFSPRGGVIVRRWQEQPLDTRTLGHNLLALELTRLHLARQTQRLTDMYAWFSERSTADPSWPPLKDWDDMWRRYTSTGGTYLKYLLRLAELLETSAQYARGDTGSAPISETLQQLLSRQHALVLLTVDYARFIDRGGEPPIPLDTLLDTWAQLATQIQAIETLTLERDQEIIDKEERKKQQLREQLGQP